MSIGRLNRGTPPFPHRTQRSSPRRALIVATEERHDLLTGDDHPAHDRREPGLMTDPDPIHITIPGCPDDPRSPRELPDGVIPHYVPELHPDDICVVDGLPVTSPSRTLIDMAEISSLDELRALFARARDLGMLDPEALAAARGRVEWRPSLEMLDEVIDEFCG